MNDSGWLPRVANSFLIQDAAPVMARACITPDGILEGIATKLAEGTKPAAAWPSFELKSPNLTFPTDFSQVHC